MVVYPPLSFSTTALDGSKERQKNNAEIVLRPFYDLFSYDFFTRMRYHVSVYIYDFLAKPAIISVVKKCSYRNFIS